MNTLKAAGLALAMALVPSASKAVEVFKNDTLKVDIGARMQLLGTMEYTGNASYQAATPTTADAGNSNRDFTRIFLFQKQNRLTMNADLEGTKVKFENAMGGEAYSTSNNLLDLMELNAEIPLGESTSVVAGLSKMPWNIAKVRRFMSGRWSLGGCGA